MSIVIRQSSPNIEFFSAIFLLQFLKSIFKQQNAKIIIEMSDDEFVPVERVKGKRIKYGEVRL